MIMFQVTWVWWAGEVGERRNE